jgi:hypothetical protein
MDLPSTVNPYQSPGSDTAPRPSLPADPGASRRLKLAWCGVFLANLCAPLWFGWLMTERGGTLGMFASVSVLFVVGYWVCAIRETVAKALVVGGVAVALTQVFPILQIAAGMAGLLLAAVMGLLQWPEPEDVFPSVTNDLRAFVVGMTTGVLLMGMALVAGLVIRALFGGRSKSPIHRSESPEGQFG